jgi:hypothetical protein
VFTVDTADSQDILCCLVPTFLPCLDCSIWIQPYTRILSRVRMMIDGSCPRWLVHFRSRAELTQSSPVQSSKLLLVLASTVLLRIGSRREPSPYFCSFQTFACFEMGHPLRHEEESNSQLKPPKSKSKLCYDRRSAGHYVLVLSTHLGPKTTFLLLSDGSGFIDVECPF